MTDDIIRISASCPDNPECFYDEGEDMPLDIRIENISGQAIPFPLAYVRRSGIFIEVVDRKTQDDIPLRRPVPRTDLLKELTVFAPGEALTVDWTLTPFDLEQFGSTVNLDAVIEVMAEVEIGGKELTALGSDTLHIRSRPRNE